MLTQLEYFIKKGNCLSLTICQTDYVWANFLYDMCQEMSPVISTVLISLFFLDEWIALTAYGGVK